MSTAIKKVGKNVVDVMLVAADRLTGWGNDTLLFRFVEESGMVTVFVAVGDAIPCFEKFEKWKIYSIEVPGSGVKSCQSMKMYGVANTQAVRFSLPCTERVHALVYVFNSCSQLTMFLSAC